MAKLTAAGSMSANDGPGEFDPDFSANFQPNWASPPGETLIDILKERHISQAKFARMTGYSAKHINQVIKGHVAISAQAALIFEQVLDAPSARFWMHREADYELDRIRLGLNRP